MREAGQCSVTCGGPSGVQVQTAAYTDAFDQTATGCDRRSQTQSSGCLKQQFFVVDNGLKQHTKSYTALAPDKLPSTDVLSTLLHWTHEMIIGHMN